MDLLIPKFIRYQLYLLQLENYELGRYWKLLFKKGPWPRGQQRKELVWSVKAKAIVLMAVALHALIVVVAGLITLSSTGVSGNFFIAAVIAIFLFLPFYFILFSVALLLLMPLDSLAKKQLIRKARAKIEQLSQPINRHATGGQADIKELKVIGVAGSYGKTTMKEVLKQVLSIKYKVLSTPESVNTPVGIARWILNKVTDDTQVLIVEMGEHYENDIKDICDIVKPDIAVVTGINESHLERMKKMDTVVATIFEIVSNTKQGATVVLNADDNRVMENYKKFVWPDHEVIKFSAGGGSASGGRVSSFESKRFNPEKLSWICSVQGMGELEVGLLGEYALGDVDAAIKIGKSLGMGNEEIKNGIAKIKPIEHRLQPMPSAANVLVIDDSYNGNPDGVREAIKVLSRFSAGGGSASGGTNRRKVYITPGLVEMGKSSPEIHREIGRQLAGVADVVILIKNSVTRFIEEGLLSVSSRPSPSAPEGERRDPLNSVEQISRSDALTRNENTKIIWFNSALEAHAGLKNILKPGDVVLFQNDWGDQYL